MAESTQRSADATSSHAFPKVRSELPLSAPLTWLALGWADLKACRGASLFYGLCFAVMGWLLAAVLRFAVHLLSGLTAGFMLLGPVVATGLYALSRQREAGGPIRLLPTLTAWKTTRGGIGVYSLILIIIYLLWARASMVSFALFYEGSMPTIEGFLAAILRLEDLEFIVIYTFVGSFFAILVYAFSVVSVPLMLDRDQDAVTAMIASVLALSRNFPALLLWAALIAVLILTGIVSGFLGLIVTGPWVGHASWHAFRALIEPLPAQSVNQPEHAATDV